MHQSNPADFRAQSVESSERRAVVIEMDTFLRARERRARPLKCVASSHLDGGCSCPEVVPAMVAEASWSRAQARGARSLEGFFHFNWQGETWLAFGLTGGEVRGVICPAHRAAREDMVLRTA